MLVHEAWVLFGAVAGSASAGVPLARRALGKIAECRQELLETLHKANALRSVIDHVERRWTTTEEIAARHLDRTQELVRRTEGLWSKASDETSRVVARSGEDWRQASAEVKKVMAQANEVAAELSSDVQRCEEAVRLCESAASLCESAASHVSEMAKGAKRATISTAVAAARAETSARRAAAEALLVTGSAAPSANVSEQLVEVARYSEPKTVEPNEVRRSASRLMRGSRSGSISVAAELASGPSARPQRGRAKKKARPSRVRRK